MIYACPLSADTGKDIYTDKSHKEYGYKLELMFFHILKHFCSEHYQTTSLTAFGFLAIVTLLIFPFFTRITLSAASANAEL